MIVRKVELKDAHQIHKNLFPKETLESIKKELKKEISEMAKGNYLRCVVETEDKIVGQACFYNLQNSGKTHIVRITSVEVTENYRGQGICTKLFNFGEEWVYSLPHVEMMILNVRRGVKAEQVYLHYGFKEFGVLERGIKENGDANHACDEVYLVKNIRN